MRLKDLAYKVSLIAVSGNMEMEVQQLAFDSRKVAEGTLFVAIRGTQADGHEFIEQAIKQGASAVVAETLPEKLQENVTYLQVADSGKALGQMAANWYGNPSEKMKVVAITGTNGKTSTATLLYNLFRDLGYKAGLLSTVRNLVDGKEITATHTTPDALQLQALLADMLASGCDYCFMEASSHAIVQQRLAGVKLAGAIFSNISHDHLDYHKTFDAYIAAKKQLFDMLPSSAWALVNIDDKRGPVMLQNTKATRHSYALKKPADFKARLISNTLEGLELDINNRPVWFQLIGDFNAYNLLAVYAAAVLLDQEEDEVLLKLSGSGTAPGRFEQVPNASGITAVVDYAHTPDALENVLKTIQNVRKGNEQVITVIGCGGNRDTTKRPLMGEIAASLSDRVVLTSDNPRNEEPEAILKDMQAGVAISQQRKVLTISDRKEAIRTACMLAQPGDIILIAGKGHETYQEIKGEKYPFDDREVVAEMLKNLYH